MKFHILVEKKIISQPRKLATQSFTFFENTTYTIKISFTMEPVKLCTKHLMVYPASASFTKRHLEIKIWDAKREPYRGERVNGWRLG